MLLILQMMNLRLGGGKQLYQQAWSRVSLQGPEPRCSHFKLFLYSTRYLTFILFVNILTWHVLKPPRMDTEKTSLMREGGKEVWDRLCFSYGDLGVRPVPGERTYSSVDRVLGILVVRTQNRIGDCEEEYGKERWGLCRPGRQVDTPH